jgi:hypothetical protein
MPEDPELVIWEELLNREEIQELDCMLTIPTDVTDTNQPPP